MSIPRPACESPAKRVKIVFDYKSSMLLVDRTDTKDGLTPIYSPHAYCAGAKQDLVASDVGTDWAEWGDGGVFLRLKKPWLIDTGFINVPPPEPDLWFSLEDDTVIYLHSAKLPAKGLRLTSLSGLGINAPRVCTKRDIIAAGLSPDFAEWYVPSGRFQRLAPGFNFSTRAPSSNDKGLLPVELSLKVIGPHLELHAGIPGTEPIVGGLVTLINTDPHYTYGCCESRSFLKKRGYQTDWAYWTESGRFAGMNLNQGPDKSI